MRRLVLSSLALLTLAAPVVASGCGAGFEPITKVEGLRVFSVVADAPYAHPGDTVHFEMTYHDGPIDPETGEPKGARPVQIVWLGGCFDPVGDQYYGCYPALADLVAGLGSPGGGPPDSPYFAAGIGLGTYDLLIPDDIVTRRPKPDSGPHYGVAYIFFAACAGRLGPVGAEGGGVAGSFPIGCFDTITGARLGADSFVPGYTQIYVFEDGRTNANPPVKALTFQDHALTKDGPEPSASICSVSEEDRRFQSCDKPDPTEACTTYKIGVRVPDDVAEIDPESRGENGEALREVVWVDYFVDRGDLVGGVALVSDALRGRVGDVRVDWIPPPESALVNVWAVVHDSRGGATTRHGQVRVE